MVNHHGKNSHDQDQHDHDQVEYFLLDTTQGKMLKLFHRNSCFTCNHSFIC